MIALLAADWTDAVFDNAFGITVLLFFVIALVTAFLRSRRRDPCLKDFQGDHVTVQLLSGASIWGNLRPYTTGLELEYREPYRDEEGHIENSFLIYKPEYATIQSIARHADDLTVEQARRRERVMHRLANPTFFSRSKRRATNLLDTVRDALVQTVQLFIGRTTQHAIPKGTLLSGDKELKGLGSQLVDFIPNAFDPLLERHLGKRVVLETKVSDQRVEWVGMLRNYSTEFLEVVGIRARHVFHLSGDERPRGCPDVLIDRRKALRIVNRHGEPIQLQSLTVGDDVRTLEKVLQPGEEWTSSKELPAANTLVTIECSRIVDLIVPRSQGLIRHAGERQEVDWVTYYNLGFAMRAVEPLRKRLRM